MSILRFLFVLFICFTVYACGGSSSDSGVNAGSSSSLLTDEMTDQATDASTNEVNTSGLRIAIVNNGHMINMQSIAKAYTDQTGIELTWVALEEDTLRQQVTGEAVSETDRYDVINIGMQEAPIWGAAGWIQPLSFSSAYDIEDIFPTIRAGLSSDGSIYAAPFYGESSFLMYRQDLANDAAVQIFDNDSWDNIELAAAAIHNPSENIYGACFRGKPGWGDNMAFVSTVANSFGAQWFNSEFRPQLDSPEWNTAINFYVNLLNNYGPPNSEENSFNEILALYNNGQCGMWIDTTVAPSFITVDNVAYAQSPNAGFPNGANWLWSWALAIPKGTPNTEEARKFIEWATSKEYIQLVANHPDYGWDQVPTGTRASTYAIPEFQETFSAFAAEKEAIESASPVATELKPYLGIQFSAIPEFPLIGAAVAQEIAAALTGDKSVEDALTTAQAAADAIMRSAGYY